MADDLVAAVAAGRNIREMEKELGLNYVKDGASMDAHVRAVTKSPTDAYWDPMHCWWGSGGIAQYHVNGLLYALTSGEDEDSLTIDEIDEWVGEIKLSGGGKFRKGFV